MLVGTKYYDPEQLRSEMSLSLKAYKLAAEQRLNDEPYPAESARAWSMLANMAMEHYAEMREQLEWQTEQQNMLQDPIRLKGQ